MNTTNLEKEDGTCFCQTSLKGVFSALAAHKVVRVRKRLIWLGEFNVEAPVVRVDLLNR